MDLLVGGEGGLKGVWEVADGLEDAGVKDGPKFDVAGDVMGVAGADEVDFVGAIGILAEGARVLGNGGFREQVVEGEGKVGHVGLSDLTLAHEIKRTTRASL